MCITLSQEVELSDSALFANIDLLASTVTITYMMGVGGNIGDCGGFFFYPGINDVQMVDAPTVELTKSYQARLARVFEDTTRSVSFGMNKGVPTSSQEQYMDGVVIKANSAEALEIEITRGSMDQRFKEIFPKGGSKVVETVKNMEALRNNPVLGRMYELTNTHGVVMTSYCYKYNGTIVIPFYENDHKQISQFPTNATRDSVVAVSFAQEGDRSEFFGTDVRFYLPHFGGKNGNLQIRAEMLKDSMLSMSNPSQIFNNQRPYFEIVD
jgi:hypothetical protein